MTVIAGSLGRLSWYVATPLIIVLLGVIIAAWVLPNVPASSSSTWLYSVVSTALSNPVTRIASRILISLAGVLGILMTLCWSLLGDADD